MLHDGTTAVIPSTTGGGSGYFPVSGGLLDVYRSECGGGNRGLVGGLLQPWSLSSNRAPFAPRSPTVDGGRPISTTPWTLLQSAELVLSVDYGGSGYSAMTWSAFTAQASSRSATAVDNCDIDKTNVVAEIGEIPNHATDHVDFIAPDGCDVIEVDDCSCRSMEDITYIVAAIDEDKAEYGATSQQF